MARCKDSRPIGFPQTPTSTRANLNQWNCVPLNDMSPYCNLSDAHLGECTNFMSSSECIISRRRNLIVLSPQLYLTHHMYLNCCMCESLSWREDSCMFPKQESIQAVELLPLVGWILVWFLLGWLVCEWKGSLMNCQMCIQSGNARKRIITPQFRGFCHLFTFLCTDALVLQCHKILETIP